MSKACQRSINSVSTVLEICVTYLMPCPWFRLHREYQRRRARTKLIHNQKNIEDGFWNKKCNARLRGNQMKALGDAGIL